MPFSHKLVHLQTWRLFNTKQMQVPVIQEISLPILTITSEVQCCPVKPVWCHNSVEMGTVDAVEPPCYSRTAWPLCIYVHTVTENNLEERTHAVTLVLKQMGWGLLVILFPPVF